MASVRRYARSRPSGKKARAVGTWLQERRDAGVDVCEMGIFVRSAKELDRAREAPRHAELPFQVLDEHGEAGGDRVSISTMHLAKGLEFRAVAVMACDDEVIPLQDRIETVADDADLEEVYDTERHLLYVACTRARDHLLITGLNLLRSSWMTCRCDVGPRPSSGMTGIRVRGFWRHHSFMNDLSDGCATC